MTKKITHSQGTQHSAIVSKLLTDVYSQREKRQREPNLAQSINKAQHIASVTAANIVDGESIQDIIAETDMVKEIVITSMFAPNDMMTTDLTFSVGKSATTKSIAGPMLQVLIKFFKTEYKLEHKLPLWAEKMLYTSGAHVSIIVPESSIDELINGPLEKLNKASMEAFSTKVGLSNDFFIRPLGTIGGFGNKVEQDTPGHFTVESLFKTPDLAKSELDFNFSINNKQPKEEYKEQLKTALENIYITDNFSALKLPDLIKRLRHRNISAVIAKESLTTATAAKGTASIAASAKKYSDEELDAMYKSTRTEFKPVRTLKTLADLTKPTLGHPTVFIPPVDSCIPIFPPNDPENPICYLFLIDKQGGFATATQDLNNQNMNNQMGANRSTQASMMQTNPQQIADGTGVTKTGYVPDMRDEFKAIVDHHIRSALKNGVYGDNVEIPFLNSFYDTAMQRALAGERTQILVVPPQLCCYMAFERTKSGTGISLTAKNKMLSFNRAMLMMADMLSAIQNSIASTTLDIKLSELDQEPDATIEEIVTNHARMSAIVPPWGALGLGDISTFLSNQSIKVNASGNSSYPETEVTVTDTSSNRAAVNTDLKEDMRKAWLLKQGVTPEMVDLGLNVEYATSIITSNLMMAKRSIARQVCFVPQAKDFVVKFTKNSAILMDELRSVVKSSKELLGELKASIEDPNSNATDMIIDQFLLELELSLPSPEIASVKAQSQVMQDEADMFDKAIDYILSDEFCTDDALGELSGKIPEIKSAMKALYMRDWMQKNNILPDLQAALTKEEDGKPSVDVAGIHAAHIEAVMDIIGPLSKLLSKNLEKFQRKYQPDEGSTDSEVNTDGNDDNPDADGDNDDANNPDDDQANGDGLNDDEENNPDESTDGSTDDTGADDEGDSNPSPDADGDASDKV